jgi:hypothetical protein
VATPKDFSRNDPFNFLPGTQRLLNRRDGGKTAVALSHRNASITRSITGCLRFFTLIPVLLTAAAVAMLAD